MPYIDQDLRNHVSKALKDLVVAVGKAREASGNPDSVGGILNYAVTNLILDAAVPSQYKHYERVVGMLECCKLEFYRRRVAPYEDLKIVQNGDVY